VKLLVLAVLAFSACADVKTATRDGASAAPRDEALVQIITTGSDGPYRIVSFSTWDVALVDDLPTQAPDEIVFDMRRAAAQSGAERLYLERYESPYRKAFYGVGAISDASAPAAVATCAHAGFAEKFKAADSRAQSCGRALKERRPQVQGKVDIVFEVDPAGGVLRAAATPDSTRDSELQACVTEAVHDTDWGVPTGFTCQGRIAVEIH